MMHMTDNGVVLPSSLTPWVYDGKEQPTIIKKVYVTPDGYFPRMRDLSTIFGNYRNDVDRRRMKNPKPKFSEWYVIHNPTLEDVQKALDNVNDLYVWTNYASDHCPICNALDDALFSEKCWLVSTTHDCAEDNQEVDEIEITYSYGGNDYSVNLLEWLIGSSPHLPEGEENE
jgi:hypothetical protein